jgi:hypothetical protein
VVATIIDGRSGPDDADPFTLWFNCAVTQAAKSCRSEYEAALDTAVSKANQINASRPGLRRASAAGLLRGSAPPSANGHAVGTIYKPRSGRPSPSVQRPLLGCSTPAPSTNSSSAFKAVYQCAAPFRRMERGIRTTARPWCGRGGLPKRLQAVDVALVPTTLWAVDRVPIRTVPQPRQTRCQISANYADAVAKSTPSPVWLLVKTLGHSPG